MPNQTLDATLEEASTASAFAPGQVDKPAKSRPERRSGQPSAKPAATAPDDDAWPEDLPPIPPGEALATDDLLAAMADDAINQALREDSPPRRTGRTEKRPDGDPPLTKAEAAALAPDEPESRPAPEPAPKTVSRPAPATPQRTPAPPASAPAAKSKPHPASSEEELPDLVTTMPTDAELDALLRGETFVPPQAGDTRAASAPVTQAPVEQKVQDHAEDALSDAAAAVAAELDAELAGLSAPPREEADEDADTIVADVAIEATVSAHAAEPVAVPETMLDEAEAALDEETAVPEPATAPRQWLAMVAAWCLLPLMWLNAPLRRAPEPVRDIVGKVALLTLLNASAVLIYTLVLRK